VAERPYVVHCYAHGADFLTLKGTSCNNIWKII
jgi:hypothetical protein